MLDPSTFAYNSEAPFEFTILTEQVKNGVAIRDVSYASPHGGKVSGYLIVSPQSQPQAGLIFGHWGEGNREEFVDEAVILANLGFVSLYKHTLTHGASGLAWFSTRLTRSTLAVEELIRVASQLFEDQLFLNEQEL